jgi:hypothetical protein
MSKLSWYGAILAATTFVWIMANMPWFMIAMWLVWVIWLILELDRDIL